jgi:hypothetical protein
MALGTGPCSNTTRKIKRPHIRGFKKYCISDETDGRDEEGAENVCIEYQSVSNKCVADDGNCEDNENEIDHRNGDESETE